MLGQHALQAVRQLASLLLIYILTLTTLTSAQKDNGAGCDCFQTNGSTSSYFLYHRFFDFRTIPSKLTALPDVITDITDVDNKLPSSDFFAASSWIKDWETQSWNNVAVLNDSTSNANVLMSYSMNNVYIEKSIEPSHQTHLTLRTARTPTFQTAAEIDSVAQNYQHISLRLLARVVGSPGACAGIFTWYCPGLCRAASSPSVEEADIEILTSDPSTSIHFTNQPSESPAGFTFKNATSNTTIPGDVGWGEWNEYRYDWLPGLSTWYVNGQETARIAFHAPEKPAGLIVNMWSNGGSWTGNMSVGDEALLQIQWIEVVYNTSGPVKTGVSRRDGIERFDDVALFDKKEDSEELVERSGGQNLESRAGKGCKVVCNIDSGTTVGTPVVNKSMARGRSGMMSIFLLAVLVPSVSILYLL